MHIYPFLLLTGGRRKRRRKEVHAGTPSPNPFLPSLRPYESSRQAGQKTRGSVLLRSMVSLPLSYVVQGLTRGKLRLAARRVRPVLLQRDFLHVQKRSTLIKVLSHRPSKARKIGARRKPTPGSPSDCLSNAHSCARARPVERFSVPSPLLLQGLLKAGKEEGPSRRYVSGLGLVRLDKLGGGDVAGRQAVRAPRRTNRQWIDGLTMVEEDVL